MLNEEVESKGGMRDGVKRWNEGVESKGGMRGWSQRVE